MSAVLNGLISVATMLATFARGSWSGGGGRPAALSLSDLVYLAVAQIGLVLAIGAGMCSLAVITGAMLKCLL